MSLYYTGIGSRNTPFDIQYDMMHCAHYLAQEGFILRSGKAEGADSAFQSGAEAYYNTHGKSNERYADIYLPWDNFGNKDLSSRWDISLTSLDNRQEYFDLASEIHPAWGKCSPAGRRLHARNVCQVLGHHIPEVEASEFVLFWAEERKGKVKGGTATAVNLAREYDITTINMYFDGWQSKLRTVVGDIKGIHE